LCFSDIFVENFLLLYLRKVSHQITELTTNNPSIIALAHPYHI